MPFKSEAQRKWMFAAESRGEVPKGTAAKWEAHTPNKKLPEHVKKAAMEKAAVIPQLLSRMLGRKRRDEHYDIVVATPKSE